MFDSQGRWIPNLVSPKGYWVFNDRHRYLLVDGPKKSGKTLSICSKLCRHAWENPNALVGVVPKTTRQAKSGVWADLLWTINEWVAGGFGFKILEGPKMHVDTKMSYIKVSNMHGGVSEFQLHALEYSHEAEERFKSTRFSMIYIPEADHFESRIVFDALNKQLRSTAIPYEAHQMIVDCNPPENGKKHWLYDVFFRVHEDPKTSEFKKSLFHRIQIVIDDNNLLDPREKQELKEDYKHSDNQFRRYVLGEWVDDMAKGIFADVFQPTIHVIGDVSSADEDEWEVITPTEQCHELACGWDLGDTNHAFVMMAKRDFGGQAAWDVIDEVVVLDRQVSLPQFTELVMERIGFWERCLMFRNKIDEVAWRHWSDTSAFRFRATIGVYDHVIVAHASNGKIRLLPVTKGPNTIVKRISLTKKLLHTKRFAVSASCTYTAAMLANLKAGNSIREPIRNPSVEKHIFDATTYCLSMECPLDIEVRSEPNVAFRPVVMASS